MSNYQYINLEYLYDMSDGENDFVIEMISDYKKKVPGYINDLQRAMIDGSMEEVKFFAHKLKSSFQFMGVKELVDIAGGIEHRVREEKEFDLIPGEINRIGPLFEIVLAELDEELSKIS